MKKESIIKIATITIFAIAMGFLETVVVVYLRKIFYSGEFNFPLKGFTDPSIIGIEWIREIATIIMLITISMLAAKKFYERASYFIYAFAVWDIFYYVFLKVLLNWPESFLAWDVLFLIPWPWAAPVLAPVLCALLMILTAIFMINLIDKDIKNRINATYHEILLVVLGIFIVLFTWLYDYGKIIFNKGATESYIPDYYSWPVFIIGFIISIIGILLFYIKNKRKLSKQFIHKKS